MQLLNGFGFQFKLSSLSRPLAAICLLSLSSPCLHAEEPATAAGEIRPDVKAAVDRIIAEWSRETQTGNTPATNGILATGGATPDERLANKLRAIGPVCAPYLIKILSGTAESELPRASLFSLLGQFKERNAIQLLLQTVRNGKNLDERSACLVALGHLDDPALVGELTGLIQPKFDPVYEPLKQALGALARAPESKAPLLKALSQIATSGSDHAKFRVIEILAEIDSAESDQMLARFLRDAAQEVRCAALRTIGMRGNADRFAVKTLEFLESDIAAERADACIALGNLNYVEAIPQLLRLLEDKRANVRDAVFQALGQISGQRLPKDPAQWKSWWENEQTNGKKEFDGLVAQLSSAPTDTLPLIVEDLSRFVALRPKVISTLTPLLAHTDFRVRAAVCNVLGQTGKFRAVEPLTERLSDPSKEVSYSAWRSLKKITRKQLPRNYDAWNAWLQDNREK